MLLRVILHFYLIFKVFCTDSLNFSIATFGNTSLLPVTVEPRRGSNLSLTCIGHPHSTDTVWKKLGIIIANYQLHFHPVKLKHSGAYECESLMLQHSLLIQIEVLPQLISARLREEVYNYIYPVRDKRDTYDSSSSSSESHKKIDNHDSQGSYREFWIVAFVIAIIGFTIGLFYYILRRYWWDSQQVSRNHVHNCRRFREIIAPESNLRSSVVHDRCNFVELPTISNVIQRDSPPPAYTSQTEMNEMPPTYEEAVNKMM